jgi:4a-hydroxytetrahydrobiopterin dehydratase
MSLRLAGASYPRERRHFFACRPATPYSLLLAEVRGNGVTGLAEKKCKPCEGGVAPLDVTAARSLMSELHAGWQLGADASYIERHFRFPGFARTIAFVNAVAYIATTEGHHPELTFTYGSCRVRYFTTAIDGLSDNDFICAAKIDRLVEDA